MKKNDRKAIRNKGKKAINILKGMSTKNQSSEDRKSQEGMNKQNGKSQKKGEQSLHTLLEKGLKDIYDAEKQLVEALPEVAQAVDNEELEDAINTHLEQTKKQVMRLEKAFERLGLDKNESEKCVAMEGLIQESKKIMQEFERSAVRDSALIIGAQKIEHYEIAVYGSLCELCDVLGEERLGDLLGRSLEEEEETDELLSEIAQDVNDEAAEMSMQEEEYQQ
jgi:ferritin-like metal-binding protein YciE